MVIFFVSAEFSAPILERCLRLEKNKEFKSYDFALFIYSYV